MGWKENPEYEADHLNNTVGYVTSVWVEQEGSRDALRWTMEVHLGTGDRHTQKFFTFLDQGTHVALAQLQILRAVMATANRVAPGPTPLLASVHFQLSDDLEWGYCTWVRASAGYGYPTTVTDYFGYFDGWYEGGWYVTG